LPSISLLQEKRREEKRREEKRREEKRRKAMTSKKKKLLNVENESICFSKIFRPWNGTPLPRPK